MERIVLWLILMGRELGDAPKCWVIPSRVVADTLRRSHVAWLALPGRGGRKHNDHDMRRLLPDYTRHEIGKASGWTDDYLEAWGLIEGKTASF